KPTTGSMPWPKPSRNISATADTLIELHEFRSRSVRKGCPAADIPDSPEKLRTNQSRIIQMITVDQAVDIVLGKIAPLGAEEVDLDSAPGRILAQDVRADLDLPPFDRARMDGFAVRSADVSIAPAKLHVIGEVAAGASFDREVGPGQAVKIFTGAP